MSFASRSRSWRELVVVLAYALAIACVPSTAIAWDGAGFLLNARPPLDLDYGHALYVPALRVVDELFGGLAGSPERAAKLFSALGAALSLWLLWRRAARAVPHGWAAAVAATFSTTPFFLRESGVVEPSTWTIAMLLLAADAAEAYGRLRSPLRLVLLVGAVFAAVGFHLVSGCALLWLALLARGPAARPPAWHLAGVLGAVAVPLALAAPRLPSFWAYWMSFVPHRDAALTGLLSTNSKRALELVGDGVPLLAVCAAIGAVRLWRVRRAALLGPLALGVPYLVAFLWLGRPLVALLLPVTLALALVVGAAIAATLQRAPASRWLTIGLPLVLLAQLATVVPHARAWTSPVDSKRQAALFFAGALPPGAILFAGPAANHVRYYTDAPVVAVPNLVQAAIAADAHADPIEVLRDEVRRQAERGAASYLTGEAFVYLRKAWSADPLRLGLEERGVVLSGGDPTISLLPIAAPAPRDGAGARPEDPPR